MKKDIVILKLLVILFILVVAALCISNGDPNLY
jgi:hypothetical protein